MVSVPYIVKMGAPFDFKFAYNYTLSMSAMRMLKKACLC